jgi:hypothetical protein
MNRRRILTGGLLAGLVYCLGGITLTGLILPEELAAAAERFGVSPLGVAAFATHVSLRLLLGFLTVWLYAAVRPRLGGGPASAQIVALVVWLFSYPVLLGLAAQIGYLPAAVLWKVALWGFVETSVATHAGAFTYMEAETDLPGLSPDSPMTASF